MLGSFLDSCANACAMEHDVGLVFAPPTEKYPDPYKKKISNLPLLFSVINRKQFPVFYRRKQPFSRPLKKSAE